MAKLRYLVLDSGGRRREVEVEASGDAAARRQLRRQRTMVIRPLGESSGRRKFRLRPAKPFDVYTFTCRLTPLLAAGIPLEHGLAVLEEGCGKEEAEVVRKLRRGLHEGKKFSQLTREMPEYFPPLFSGLIESGEESGCLPEVAAELRRFLKESREFREFVLTSSIYPAIVVSVTLLVIVLLFTVFIPRFAKIFEELGREMPLLTRAMLGIGNFMEAVWWFWPLLIAGAVLFYRKSAKQGKLKRWKDRMALKLPLVGGIVTAIQTGRFLRTLSIMVKNHVQLLSAVRVSRRVIGNGEVRESFSGVEEELRGGGRLSAILGKSPYMPQGTVAMLKIAEESGELGEMLERIAEESEEETRVRVKRLLAFLEPGIILVLAGVVLLVVLSIFLAIMEMNVIK
ncbi:putative type II secretion system protein F [bioreactor metagenome]|uniref:Putative type II secretion system protein F n=1 Tax=bioreactor metagenome TaxID=1076179 RepID=A0A645ATP5_9ZZZZ